MLKGILIDEKFTKFTDIVIGRRTSTNQWFTVCTKTGMNREVRKIFNAHNLQISRLKRVRFGPFFLPESLAEGNSWSSTYQTIRKLLMVNKDDAHRHIIQELTEPEEQIFRDFIKNQKPIELVIKKEMLSIFFS